MGRGKMIHADILLFWDMYEELVTNGERKKMLDRLAELEFTDGEDSHARLSKICATINGGVPEDGWSHFACKRLVEHLMSVLLVPWDLHEVFKQVSKGQTDE